MNRVRTLRQHQFGNVVLSRYPIVHHSQYDLSWRTCEPRNCQRADLERRRPDRCTSTTSTSGTAVLERRYQAKRLAVVRPRSPHHRAEDHPRRLQRVDEGPGDQDAVVALRERRHLAAPQAAAHLSRPLPRRPPRSHLLRGHVEVRSVEMPRTRKSLMASDHLPLVATLQDRTDRWARRASPLLRTLPRSGDRAVGGRSASR